MKVGNILLLAALVLPCVIVACSQAETGKSQTAAEPGTKQEEIRTSQGTRPPGESAGILSRLERCNLDDATESKLSEIEQRLDDFKRRRIPISSGGSRRRYSTLRC